MRKQAWLYLNLGILSILFLGWMGNSAEAATAHIAQPQNGSCTNESTIVLRVEIDSGKEDVKIVKFWLDQSAPIEQGNNPSWGREPGPWDFSRDVVRPDEPVWWYYETEWNVSGMSDHNYSLTYWLIDRNGKTIYFGETVAFGSDRTIPGGSITAPSNGQTITGDKIHITASASDNLCGVDWVKFLVHTPNERKGSKNSQWSGSDGDFWFSYTDNSSPWSPPDWDMTGIPDGDVTITIWVGDKAGNQFEQPTNERVTVHVKRETPPSPPSNLIALANGTTVNLTWKDNSNNEQGFKIERKTGASG
ncbi:Ig-like domain-containing protein, partial [bacterium]|nr:Ig-like domain-containing protein [bacterium]